MNTGELAGDVQGAADAGQRPLCSLTLRGGSVDLWPERATVGAASYPLGELVQAALVPYPGGSPGLVGLGVLLRTRDGRAPLLIPEDIAEAQRFLGMIYMRRPDLRAPPPPFPPPYPPYPPYPPQYAGYSAQPLHPSGIPEGERVWAMLSHLSAFFIPLWFPLIVWLATQQTMPYASRQAKQAFFFHLIVAGVVLFFVVPVYAITVFGMLGSIESSSNSAPVMPFPPSYFLGFALVWLVIVLIGITNIAYGIYGAVQAFQGKPFHYPLLGRV
ncbi:MAG: DUF4870 domain-containing protein [Ktedonobacterales bacterium]